MRRMNGYALNPAFARERMKRITGDVNIDDRLSCVVGFSPDEECAIGNNDVARPCTRGRIWDLRMC